MPQPSALQYGPVCEFSNIGLQPEEEVPMLIGYHLDALVEIYRQRIGIEVDRPSHFTGKEPTSNTIFKRWHFSNIDGIPIVHVPYWEWNEFGNDGSWRKQENLWSRLELQSNPGYPFHYTYCPVMYSY